MHYGYHMRYSILSNLYPPIGCERYHRVRDVVRFLFGIPRYIWFVLATIWDHIDYDPVCAVIAFKAGILFVIGLTLAQAGNTFDISTFAVIRTIVSEQTATTIAFVLAVLGIVSVVPEHTAFRCVMAFIYTVVFLFVGITFYLSSPLSTGTVYIMIAIVSFWAFIKGLRG